MCDFFIARYEREVFMSVFDIIVIALGVSADAFAVSMCKGVEMKKIIWKYAILIAVFFGGFQMIMPLIGWGAGSLFQKYITEFDHWIAFGLLLILGGKMLYDGIFDKDKKKEGEEEKPMKLGFFTLLLMAIATSIDALAVGVTFAFLKVNVWLAVSIIGATTFAFSLVGVGIGVKVGDKFKNKAEILGGAILILLGIKILLEHLGVINF